MTPHTITTRDLPWLKSYIYTCIQFNDILHLRMIKNTKYIYKIRCIHDTAMYILRIFHSDNPGQKCWNTFCKIGQFFKHLSKPRTPAQCCVNSETFMAANNFKSTLNRGVGCSNYFWPGLIPAKGVGTLSAK